MKEDTIEVAIFSDRLGSLILLIIEAIEIFNTNTAHPILKIIELKKPGILITRVRKICKFEILFNNEYCFNI